MANSSDLSVEIGSLTISGLESPESMDAELINTKELLSEALNAILPLVNKPPSLYIDLEGINLSRTGTISILQIYAAPLDRVYLIDVHRLRSDTFTTGASCLSDQTLKYILEYDSTPKVFFDVRNDSDALFAHYNISLRGIVDLQLMEIGSRGVGRRKFVSGLAKCIERDSGLDIREKALWAAKKDRGNELFAPERGGSYDIFNERPLPREIVDYCSQDVRFLPMLWTVYNRRLAKDWNARVHQATLARVHQSQSPGYNGKGRDKAMAPKGWNYIR